jgi:plasmid stabilization system protein ParE
MEIRYLTPARLEFVETVSYYEAQAAGLGADFLQELNDAELLIAENPEIGSPFGGELRRVLLRRFPFYIVYSVEPDHLLVVAVAHQRREPGYWRDRIQG